MVGTRKTATILVADNWPLYLLAHATACDKHVGRERE